MLQSDQQKFEAPRDFLRLWRHEMHKVVMDRLINQEDRDLFANDIVGGAIKKKFADTVDTVMADPCL